MCASVCVFLRNRKVFFILHKVGLEPNPELSSRTNKLVP